MQGKLKLSNFTLKWKGKCSGSKTIIQKKKFLKKEIYFMLSETRFDTKQRKNNECRQVFLFCDWSKKKGCVDINTAVFCKQNVLEIPYSQKLGNWIFSFLQLLTLC